MNNTRAKIFLRRNIEGVVAYGVLAVVLVLYSVYQADFFTVYGPQSIFNQVITLCVAALGQTIVVLTAGIDLSIGSLVIFTNCVAATIFAPVTAAVGGSILLGSIATIAIVLVIGLICGLINGAFVVYGRLQPIVVTLATGSIFSGLARYVRPSPGGDVPSEFARFMTGRIGDVFPMSALILILVIVCIWVPYRNTRYGQALYAIGGNEKASFLNGIQIDKAKLIAYAMAGLSAAICGVLLTAQTRSGDPTASNNFTNNSIAAAVLGGASLAGGKGSYFGSVAGAMTLALISGLLIFWGISSYYQNLVQGLILILVLSVGFISEALQRKKEQIKAMGGN